MKIHHALILVLVLGFVAFGQIGCPRGGEEAEVGNQGVVVDQISGAPPTQVSKGQEFPFMVFLENKGSYDVKQGEAKVFLGGFLPELFSLAESDLIMENREGLKKANIAAGISGDRERIIFTENARYVGQNIGYTQAIFYRTCYIYETEVNVNICFALESSEVCTLEGDKIETASLGEAPIQVTSITEERSGQNVQLNFKIENVGSGKVYLPTVNCESPETFLKDSVLVSVVTEEPFDCSTLNGGKTGEGRVNSIISCKRNMQGISDRLSPVKLRLRYTYVETTETTVGVTE